MKIGTQVHYTHNDESGCQVGWVVDSRTTEDGDELFTINYLNGDRPLGYEDDARHDATRTAYAFHLPDECPENR